MHERIPASNGHVNPFRVAFGRYCGRDRLCDNHPAAGRARLPAGRVNEGGLPMSSLQPMLQDQEIPTPASHYWMRQGAATQVSLLPSLLQVQSRHTEARHARTSGSAASVSEFLSVARALFWFNECSLSFRLLVFCLGFLSNFYRREKDHQFSIDPSTLWQCILCSSIHHLRVFVENPCERRNGWRCIYTRAWMCIFLFYL